MRKIQILKRFKQNIKCKFNPDNFVQIDNYFKNKKSKKCSLCDYYYNCQCCPLKVFEKMDGWYRNCGCVNLFNKKLKNFVLKYQIIYNNSNRKKLIRDCKKVLSRIKWI